MPRIWFNRHFSVVARVIALLRAADPGIDFWALVSHRHAHFAGFAMGDEALMEPVDLPPPAYLDWCLGVIRRFSITHLVPGHEQSFLTRQEAVFAEAGCTVIRAAPPEWLADIHRKDWLYAQLGDLLPLPPFEVVESVDAAAAVVRRLEADGAMPCLKPCVSVYGHGFYRIRDEAPVYPFDLSIADWIAQQGPEPLAPHLVMAYLPGTEYSVDVAAEHGRVLALSTRRKGEHNIQELIHHPALAELTVGAVERLRLNGLSNFQFKEDQSGKACFLEINPRASGGIGMACAGGINLPAVAYRPYLAPGSTEVVGQHTSLPVRVTEIPMARRFPQAICEA